MRPRTRRCTASRPRRRPPRSAAARTTTSSTARCGRATSTSPARPPAGQHLLQRGARRRRRDRRAPRGHPAQRRAPYEELQEVVMHVAVYLGWPVARRLDDLLVAAATRAGVIPGAPVRAVLAGRRGAARDGSRLDRLPAVFTSDTWVNACGKLPSMPARRRVVLLGEQADVVARAPSSRSNSAPGLVGAARAARGCRRARTSRAGTRPRPAGGRRRRRRTR